MNLRLLTLASAFAFASAAMAQELEVIGAPAPASQPAAEPAYVAPSPAAEPAYVAPAPAAEPAPTSQPAAEPAYVAQAPAAEPAPSSVASESAASGDEVDFDVMRARAYDVVGNQAAAPTVANFLAAPYNLAGKKLVYVEPTNSFAFLSFGEGMTKFVAFDNSLGLGKATFGIASKGFGASVDYAFGKRWRFNSDEAAGATANSDVTNITAGDLLQATFSMPLGPIDLAVRGFWLTWQNETETKNETANTETDQDYWDYGAELTISNDPSGKDLFWSAGLLFSRHASYVMRKIGGTITKTNGQDATLTLQPSLNLGVPVLKAQNARVLLGVNGAVPVVVYDGADNVTTQIKDDRVTVGLVAMPNILGELALGKCWMVFAGAAYAWDMLDMDRETYVTGNGTPAQATSTITILTMRTNAPFVNGGARFQYRNFAVEAAVANNFFNNPLEGFNGTNFIANLGGFIYF